MNFIWFVSSVLAVALFPSSTCSLLKEISTQRVRPSALNKLSNNAHTITLTSLAEIADLGSGMNLVGGSQGRILESPKGIRRARLHFLYNGYEIFGVSAEAEIDSNGHYTGQMYGYTLKDLHKHIPDPHVCQRNVQELINMAIELEGLNSNGTDIRKQNGRRIVFVTPKMKKAKLAYRIEFMYMNDQDMRRPVYFFEACNDRVLLSFNQIKNRSKTMVSGGISLSERGFTNSRSQNNMETSAKCTISAVGKGGNKKIGKITYNTPPFCLNVQQMDDNICKMEGEYGKVIDNEQTNREDKETVITFPCTSGYRDAINGAFGVANDALFYGELTGRFFKEKYNVIALPHKPRLVVHYGKQYQNAFWDGNDLYFGDCKELLHPFVDVDTIAHELAHGVIEFSSDLVYKGMSGGINEAFADITGETTKHYLRNSSDWLVDYDIVKGSAGFEALRYFEDPPKDGHSIKHIRDYRPRLDVHHSSGIFNHAFYTMVVHEGLDIYDAYKCFLDANLSLWKPFTNFFSGACNVMQAAYDNGFDHEKVRRSFKRVGIPLKCCNYSALSTSVFVGETRQGILVSATRSPILKIELDPHAASQSTIVRVAAEDESQISLVLGKDDAVKHVIARRNNAVIFDNSIFNVTHVYVMLKSDSTADVKTSMNVDGI